MPDKRVLNKMYLEVPTGTDRSTNFRGAQVQFPRGTVDVSSFGSLIDASGLTTYACQFVANLIYQVDQVFRQAVIAAMKAETELEITMRESDAAESATNPTLVFSVVVPDPGAFGGSRGEAGAYDVTWPIISSITVDDGVTPYTIP